MIYLVNLVLCFVRTQRFVRIGKHDKLFDCYIFPRRISLNMADTQHLSTITLKILVDTGSMFYCQLDSAALKRALHTAGAKGPFIAI